MSWPTVKLGDVCHFVRGPFGGSLKKDFFVSDGYAVYEQQHAINNQFNEIRYFIDQNKFVEMKRFELLTGDLIMSCSGTMGRVAIVPENIQIGIINQALLKLTPSSKLDINYLKYWMESETFQFLLAEKTNGAAIKNVPSVKVLKELEIPLPPLPEQKRIADILDKADNLRQKRQRAIDLADEFLRSVFLDMFGDPSNNLKNLPVGTIRDLLSEAKYGTSAKASETVGKYPVLRMGNITYKGNWNLDSLKYVDLSEQDQVKYLAQAGDIVFNRTNSRELVGKTAVYNFDYPMALAGYLIRSRVNEKGNPYYISAYLNSKHGKETLMHMCKSIVGMANINAQEMQDIKILIPTIELQNRYQEIELAVHERLKKIQLSFSELNLLFNSLSKKAFAGEL